jgi:hypothetical protein
MSRYTKTSVWMLLAGVGFGGVATDAHAFGGPAEVDLGFHCNFSHGGVRATFGPWYAYFPYDAHFQMPAPMGMYPNWPMPFPPQPVMVPAPFPPPFPPPPTPVPMTPPNPAPRTAPANQPLIQPVGYYPYGYGYGYQVPSYWYGR